MMGLCSVLLFIFTFSSVHHSLEALPASTVSGLPHGRVVACYVGTWATYRAGNGKFTVEDIDPKLCSHIVYAFAGLNATTSSIKSLDPWNDLEDDSGKGSYKKMTALKLKYPHLKVTVAIGGWNEGSANYSALAANPDSRKKFAKSVSVFLKKYDFDGLDLDWEFPGKRGGKPEDKEKFSELIKDLRDELPQGEVLLTAALGAGIDTLQSSYNLTVLDKYLDFMHLMCYDYHGSWESSTGSNAPLGSAHALDPLTVKSSIKYALLNGVRPEKLVLGVPFYGRTFFLEDAHSANSESLGERSVQNRGFKGPYTATEGFLGYNEICLEVKNNNWTSHWDTASSTPFVNNGDRIISYDNPRSLEQKVRYAVSKNLAGIMLWSMDTDDFKGDCAEPATKHKKYPLLYSINDSIIQALKDKKTKATTEKPSSAITTHPGPMILISSSLLLLWRHW